MNPARRVTGVLLALVLAAGCQDRLDLGSNVLWASLFEGGTFDEWTSAPGGSADAFPSGNTIAVTDADAHHGTHAALLTIDAGPDGTQANAGLVRKGGLPVEAYYSCWYELPSSVTVGAFWILFKIRLRTDAGDASSEKEFYDLELVNTPDGSLALRLYDHQSGLDVPLLLSPAVPVGSWFQVEAFYRNAQDDTGRLTFWLNGVQVVDVRDQPMAPTPWIEWDAVNVGENLTPSTAVVLIDDCAVSLSRVGLTGLIAE